MPEKFLILGSSSFYGRNFAEYVRKRGDKPILLSKPGWHLGDEVPDAAYVVNFASASLVAESWDNPGLWITTNVQSTTAMFRKLIGRCLKFVHVSTPESYGDTDDGWVEETYTAWKPSTPYAVSRAAADMMLMAYHRAYRFPAIITRTANIYGPGQQAHRFIPLAFDTFRRGEKLLLHGGGHTRRCFIHVRDACAALYLLAKQGSVGQTYHISTTQDVSISELAHQICRMLGKRSQDHIGTQPDRLGKDHAYLLDSTKLRNMGWRDTITLEKGLQEYGSRTGSAG